MILHRLFVVDNIPGTGLLGVARPQEAVGLGLRDDGGRDHGRGHVHVELGADQQPNGRAEPRVGFQYLKDKQTKLFFFINYWNG